MTEPVDLQPVTLSHAAIWALERLSQPRYGRDTPALSWSITHELIRAGFVAVSENGRRATTLTQAGRNFLLGRTRV
ncbi:hypothetical protein PPMP20_01440 [Paraburkholderia phymatum]|uniref:Uncharacterized protein n=1 Tax=Paraburkholderia phymatum (strain DSM 17167 / CIP 108236 / LMG 21445 / STM815) TaxID=391038 RepID=B2JVZ5_PARP8|nr:hypothetical protein [Paraburkholderia phymatum]ACC75122.1 conserved hypothetical protein [Paraburkholderia phymatum STM815]